MKIVLVNQEHAQFGGPGGAERSVQSIAEYFASAGHQVTFIAMAPKAYQRDMNASGLHSIREINGVKTILMGRSGRIPTHADLLLPVILAEAPDVVHTNVFHKAPMLWNALAPWGIPVIHTLREYKLMCDRNMFNGIADCGAQCFSCDLSARHAVDMSQTVDGVIGISQFTLDRHLQDGLFANAVVKRVIPNSYRLKDAAPPRVPRRPGAPVRVGYLGRMHASKGITLVIDAIARLNPDAVTLMMAGDLQDADISDRIRVLSQTHDARFLGFVDPTTFFPQIDVLLAPSIWHEPFGRITIEAFAHGVPVIATNRGGLPDIVQDGINGWIFDPDRLDDLVAILQRVGAEIDRDPAGLQQRCLDRAQDYLPYKIGDRYLETYREVADLKRATRPVVIDRVRGVYEREARALNLGTSLRTRIPQRERKPLKALIVSGEFPKLSETFVLNHITGLIDLGVDVKVLHARSGAPHETPPDFIKYRIHDRTIKILPDEREEQFMRSLARGAETSANRIDSIPAALIEEGSSVATVLREGRSELMQMRERMLDLYAAQQIAAHARDVDIVHCHFGHRPKSIFKYIDMGAFQAPVVCSFHGIDMSAHIDRFGPTLYNDIKGRLHKALPVSDFFRQRLIGLGFHAKDVQVHRVGIDCSRFVYADRSRAPGEVLRLISVGRLVHKKGIEYGIRAVAVAQSLRPDLRVEYSIIGGGDDIVRLQELVGELGIGEQVQLLGPQPHARVTALMAASHAMLTPSVTGPDGDMEGIPTVTMEAMASGLPVIATLHSGIPEAVVDGYTGLLSPEKDVEAMAENIIRLYDHPAFGSRLGRQGRAHVLQEFNIVKQNQKVLDLYQRIVSGLED